MPKLKTKRAAAKRFTVTSKGKIRRRRAYHGHLMTGKSKRLKRAMRKSAAVSPADEARIRATIAGKR